MSTFAFTLLENAQKTVFIVMAIAVVAAVFIGKITGEQFLVLASMAFAAYFSTPGQKSQIADTASGAVK